MDAAILLSSRKPQTSFELAKLVIIESRALLARIQMILEQSIDSPVRRSVHLPILSQWLCLLGGKKKY
jgi:hypothetical protein